MKLRHSKVQEEPIFSLFDGAGASTPVDGSGQPADNATNNDSSDQAKEASEKKADVESSTNADGDDKTASDNETSSNQASDSNEESSSGSDSEISTEADSEGGQEASSAEESSSDADDSQEASSEENDSDGSEASGSEASQDDDVDDPEKSPSDSSDDNSGEAESTEESDESSTEGIEASSEEEGADDENEETDVDSSTEEMSAQLPEDLHATDPIEIIKPDDEEMSAQLPEDLHATDPIEIIESDDETAAQLPDDLDATDPIEIIEPDQLPDDLDASDPIEVEGQSDEDSESETLVVIDESVEGSEDLVDLPTNATVITIDKNTTAQQLADLVKKETSKGVSYSRLEIYAHKLQIGAEDYSEDGALEEDSEAWETIGQSLDGDAEILLFGCDVAKDEKGKDVVNDLADITETTVYASDDASGVGGDWVLEYSSDPQKAAVNSNAYSDAELESADVSLAFTSGGIVNKWTTTKPVGSGDVEITFNEIHKSQNGDATSFNEALNFAHSYTGTEGGESLSDYHLFEWENKAEYDAFIASMTPAQFDEFSGAITAAYDTGAYDGVATFNDPQGDRFGQTLGGSVANPNNSSGANYAPWDTIDGSPLTNVERAVVVSGGVLVVDDAENTINNATPGRTGVLHTVVDGLEKTATNDQSGFEPNAVILQTSVVVENVAINNDAAAVSVEHGFNTPEAQFLNDVNVTVGDNTYVDSLTTTISNDAGLTVSFDGALVANSVEAQFNHVISGNQITITAAPGQEPGQAAINAYLDGFVIDETANGTITADKVVTGTMEVTTKDIFGQDVTFTDQGNYTVNVDYDRTIANDDGVAVGNTNYETPEDTTLNIPASDGLLVNDSDLNGDSFTVISNTPPSVGGTLNVNPDGSFSYTPPANYTGPVTFDYTISDGDVGEDTATVTLNVGPVNDLPEPTLDVVGGPLVEENGAEKPFDSFTLTDADTTPGAITVDFSSGWVDGDREVDITSLQANHPSLTITHDTTTGNVTFSNAGSATTTDFESAVKDISISVADNQPDLAPLVGAITVYDSVDSSENALPDLQAILAGDQTSSVDFSIDVTDRLEVSGGDEGLGNNTGHDKIPDQIKTDDFNTQFPQTDIDDAQGVYVENEAPINPFDDAAFESRDGELTEITLDVQSGWVDGESTWVVDDTAFANVNIEVTQNSGGDLTFTPISGNSFSADDLNSVMQSGGLTFEAVGEKVTASTIEAVFSGEDTNGLSESGADTTNNVDADADGVIKIIQLGVNDAPEVTLGSAAVDSVQVVVEGGESVKPLEGIEISDIDSDQIGSAQVEIDGPALEYSFDDNSQQLISDNSLEVTITDSLITITGDAPLDVYEDVLAGLIAVNPDDDVNNEGSQSISLTVSVTDVSETGFNDHLSSDASLTLERSNSDEPVVPEPPKPTPPPLVEPPVEPPVVTPNDPDYNRHIAMMEEDIDSVLEEIIEEEELPSNLHIHFLVNQENDLLEGQTSDQSGLHISKMVDSDKVLGELNPEIPEEVVKTVESLPHAKQVNYLVQSV